MPDKTFRSELVELLEKYEVGVISNTSPAILAEKIEQDINVHNLISVQRDKATNDYIAVLESQNKDLAGKLRELLDKK